MNDTPFIQDVLGGIALSTNLFEATTDQAGGLRFGVSHGKGLQFNPAASSLKQAFFRGTEGTVLGGLGAASTLGTVGLTLLGPLAGFKINGVQGAMVAMAGDVALNTALTRHHFRTAAAAGNIVGDIVAPGLISGMGTSASLATRAFNTALYATMSAGGFVGGAVGGWIGGKVGDLIGGNVGNFVGSVGGTAAGTYLGSAAIGALGAAGPVTMGIAAVTALGAAATVGSAAAVSYGTYSVLKAGYRHQQARRGVDTSGSLAAFYTQGAMTMRQRAVSAIHKSHLNARSALGQEASLMHFPSRNYHSKYRRFY